MRLKTTKEQKNILRSHFISTPVSDANTPYEKTVTTIMFESWLPLKKRLYSLGRESSKANNCDRLIPYKIEQRYDAAAGKRHTAKNAHIIPEDNCSRMRLLNLMVSVALRQPKTKRKIVLIIQNIEVNCTAYSLVFMPVSTAQVGIQPWMVTSIPTEMKKPKHSKISNFFDPFFIFYLCSVSSFDSGFSDSGAGSQQRQGTIMRQAPAVTINIFCQRRATMTGATNAPIPKTPCEKETHNPVLYMGAASTRQTLVVIFVTFANMLSIDVVINCQNIVSEYAKQAEKAPMPKRHKIFLWWMLGMMWQAYISLYPNAAMKLLMEMSKNNPAYSVQSMLRSSARKGISDPMQVKGTDIMRNNVMQANRQALLKAILKMILQRSHKKKHSIQKKTYNIQQISEKSLLLQESIFFWKIERLLIVIQVRLIIFSKINGEYSIKQKYSEAIICEHHFREDNNHSLDFWESPLYG